VPIQPLIAPLFEGLTEIELLARLAGLEPNSGYEIVRETFRAAAGGGEEDWKRFLHNGYQEGSAAKPVEVTLAGAAVNGTLQAAKPTATKDGLEVVFHRHYCIDDGRYNNNGWLQELPEPITKVGWENLILLSPATFEKLGLVNQSKGGGTTQASLVKVVLDGREVVGPAWLQPGMADNTIGLSLGYGRQLSGRVGRGAGSTFCDRRVGDAGRTTAPGCHHAASLVHGGPARGARGQSRTVLRAPGLRAGHEAGAAADHPAALPESLRRGQEERAAPMGHDH
jgi:molybdopterin-containing oxidoreductase family iron-sulfur binding subunit